ncbi:MAG TPA: site-2 protease family protein [Longimicrobiales bacterium]|nr:site-2 protease family protein [Longimicrobiales bacterium]
MRGYRLGRVMGIDIQVHPSWSIIALLVMWSLATAALPADFPDLASGTRFLMAAGITLLFFLSLLAHELAHSMVAVVRGIPVHRITFFLFGGMAQTSRDSRSPGEEFLIAIAGPVCSLLLAGLFLSFWWLGEPSWPTALAGSAAYLGVLNLVLAVFNMLPGYPMDGGRVLRAIIWKISGSVDSATRWASRVGVWMATGLMLFGAWDAATGDLMGGLWLVLIGYFVQRIARAGYPPAPAHGTGTARGADGPIWDTDPGGPAMNEEARREAAMREAAMREAAMRVMREAMRPPAGGSTNDGSRSVGEERPPRGLTGRDVTDLTDPRDG